MPPFVIHPQSDPARGQAQFSHKLIAILFKEKKAGISRKKVEDKYLITFQQASVISIETDDLDLDFSKIFYTIHQKNPTSKIT